MTKKDLRQTFSISVIRQITDWKELEIHVFVGNYWVFACLAGSMIVISITFIKKSIKRHNSISAN